VNLNSYVERFVRTIKESCLERMVLFGEDARRTAIREFLAHSGFWIYWVCNRRIRVPF
jgi:hypothetical protein